jgi:D-arginine dehydrogenase
MTETSDFIVIGAGASGASAAAHLAPLGTVQLLEAEQQPGYHSTGRSAALWTPHYGNAPVRRLIAGSAAFLNEPPDGFADHPLLTPRGAMTVADATSVDALADTVAELDNHPRLERLDGDEAVRRVPILRRDVVVAGLYDPDVADMDVNAIHRGFLRMASKAGARLQCDARVDAIARDGGVWLVAAGGDRFEAPVVVNAAGAWADEIGQMAGLAPIGLTPMRRTAIIVDGPDGIDAQGWPAVDRAAIESYFKPDAGKLMMSPGDETPVPPQDVQPDDFDVAVVIDWFETVTTLPVRQVRHRWAGLRSFVADRAPVVGFDEGGDGFFWLAGQGGYGIMLAPVLGRVTASLIATGALPADLAPGGLDAADLAPARLR